MNTYNVPPVVHVHTEPVFSTFAGIPPFWSGAGSWADGPGLCPEPEEEDPLKGLRRENWVNLERFDEYPS